MIDFIGTVIACVLLVFLILSIKIPISYVQCNSYHELTGRNTKYSVISGCYIEFNGKYIPRSELEKRFITDSNN